MRPALGPWLLAVALAAGLGAQSLELPESDPKALAKGAVAVAKALAAGKKVSLALDTLAPRGTDGAWNQGGLGSALSASSPFLIEESVLGDGWLARDSPSRILLIENKSSIGPLSKQLPAWGWPFQSVDFEEVEKAPKVWLDASAWDLVVFSSPGWWDNFSNNPSGPSRMGDAVVESVRRYVSAGGSALFIDIAQWDLERCWPHSLHLEPLGPWQLDRFKAEGMNGDGKLSLAPEGVASDKVAAAGLASLIHAAAFKYPDGSVAPAYAAYAFPDPLHGKGMVAGMAFHVFDQDDSLAGRAKRIFLNLLFASGASRIKSQMADIKLPSPVPSPLALSATAEPTARATERPAPPSPTLAPSATLAPSPPATAPPTELPTLAPTPKPSVAPTLAPTPLPSPAPTAQPSQVPTPLPSPLPRLLPTVAPTALPSLAPTSVPSRVPTPAPTVLATRAATPVLIPISKPAPPPPALLPELPVPALPTAMPTLAALPTPRPRPTLRPSPLAEHTPKAHLAPTMVPIKVRDAIGCIQSSPEPFGEGGVYVFYCLKHAATITFKVFTEKGKLLYAGDPKFVVPGSHQEFYGGVDLKGLPIKPGHYHFRLEAVYDEHSSEWRQSEFNLKRKRR